MRMKLRLMNDCAVARTNWQKYMPALSSARFLIVIPRKDSFAIVFLLFALVARSPVIHVDSGHEQHLQKKKKIVCFVRNREHSDQRLKHLIAVRPEAYN